MGSLARTYSEDKTKGRIYTPAPLVARILDAAGYSGPCVASVHVLDPACGDGQFLTEIVRRILEETPRDRQLDALHRVAGWDIDPEAIAACRRRLDALVAPHGLALDWNVRVCNALQADLETANLFDVIVGNPPYVRIQHLSEAERQLVQSRFQFCTAGSTDLYIAFFELALARLSPGGVLAFITPNTYFYTLTGGALRTHLVSGQRLRQIVNFGHRQVFPNATTYAAITVAANEPVAHFTYIDASDNPERPQSVGTRQLEGQRIWRLGGDALDMDPKRYRPLREIANIHVGLATLADAVFIVQDASAEDRSASDTLRVVSKRVGEIELERGLLRPVIKGSKVKAGVPCHTGAYVLFPYEPFGTRSRLIPEDELAERYPLGYAYLKQAREVLDRRDNGRPNAQGWYAFGRSQALRTSFGEKIICPPMAKEPTFVVCRQPETTVYAGYVVKYDGDLDALAAQLNSDRMQAWVQSGGRDYMGGWKGYSKTSFQDFPIDVTQL
ncbi:MAG: Eco57I restriction-modification methylase domain-containing protein [Rubricoccaceae bacterium]